jgi:hypothetical protein
VSLHITRQIPIRDRLGLRSNCPDLGDDGWRVNPSHDRLRISTWLTAGLVTVLASCTTLPGDAAVHHASGDGARPRALTPEPVQVLGASIEVLKAAFNGAKDRPRVIALLSPSCPRCQASSESILSALEGAPDGLDPAVMVVWLEVFATDDAQACREGMVRFAGTPVEGFLDDERIAGRLLTRGRLPIGVARHLFLWYEPGIVWLDGPPDPTGWCHQLRRYDPETFCSQERLKERLATVFRNDRP